ADGLRVLGLKLLAHGVLERLQRLETQSLGQLVVDRNFVGGGNGLDGHVERRLLPGKVRRSVVRWEGYVDGLRIASRQPDKLLFESGDELFGADADCRVVVSAAFESRAIHFSGV